MHIRYVCNPCCQNALENNYSKSRPLNRDRCCFNRMCGFLSKSHSSGKDHTTGYRSYYLNERRLPYKSSHISIRGMHVCVCVWTSERVLERERGIEFECIVCIFKPVFCIFFFFCSHAQSSKLIFFTLTPLCTRSFSSHRLYTQIKKKCV